MTITLDLRNSKKTLLEKIYLSKMLKYVLVLVLVVSAFILVDPLIPALQYKFIPPIHGDTPNYPISYVNTGSSLKENNSNQEKVYLTDGNRLFIPKIGVDTKILEGDSVDVLLSKEGVWREPETSNPTTSGNMVIGGHRFQYLPPNTTTFYNLDKLEVGDKIKVYWDGKEYNYEIYKIFEVNPDEVWIKNPDENVPEITLYTCTPIYTSEKRLVVKAKEVPAS